MILPPPLLQKLSRSRLLVRHASASSGIGERQSDQKGVGLEFADHREYQSGDNLRHIDPHLYARFGKPYVREYSVDQQLPITVVFDASGSMDYGTPNKLAFTRQVAAGFAFVGLAGGDLVQIGAWSHDRVEWSPRVNGIKRASALMDWIGKVPTGGVQSFDHALRSVPKHVVPGGLVILISDWWVDQLRVELRALGGIDAEIVGLHVVAPEELEPSVMGLGEARLTDLETGHEFETALDAQTFAQYRREFAAWRDDVARQIRAQRGRYMLVQSDADLADLFLKQWRVAGLIS